MNDPLPTVCVWGGGVCALEPNGKGDGRNRGREKEGKKGKQKGRRKGEKRTTYMD